MNWLVMEEAMRRLGLTEREREVTRLYASGVLRAEIAAVMFLEEHTVSNHLTSVYRKANLPGSKGPHRKVQLLRLLHGLSPCVPLGVQ